MRIHKKSIRRGVQNAAFSVFRIRARLAAACIRPAAAAVVDRLESRTLLSFAYFAAPSPTVVGNHPSAVAAADLNNDKKVDLVVANERDNNLTVFVGDSDLDSDGGGTPDNDGDLDGGFATHVTVSVANGPTALAVADLGNGRADILAACPASGEVSILLNDGFGDFPTLSNVSVPLGISGNPDSIAVADVNGDGKADLIVATGSGHKVSIFLGNGDGNFKSPTALSLPAGGVGNATLAYAAAVVVGNFNGNPDIAVTDSHNNQVDVLYNNGNGIFKSPVVFAVGTDPESLAVSDVNRDGRPDLIVADAGSSQFSVLLGATGPTFTAAPAIPLAVDGAVSVGDFNGDGNTDIVGTHYSSGVVTIALGNGDGTFGNLQSFAAGNHPDTIAVADLNGDSKTDLVVANYSDNVVSVLQNTTITSDGFSLRFSPEVYAGENSSSVVAADFNGDGKPDIAVANTQTNYVEIFLQSADTDNDGSAHFTFAANLRVAAGPTFMTLSDVNGDGLPDLVVASPASSAVSVLISNGDGTFQHAVTTTNLPQGSHYNTLALADFNGDGSADLAVVSRGTHAVNVLLGNGDGTFGSPVSVSFSSNFATIAVVAADVNNDGLPDLIVTTTGGVVVRLNNGSGGFDATTPYAIIGATAVTVADVNGDGRSDILVAAKSQHTVDVLLNNGGGVFAPPAAFAAGTSPDSVAVADFNGDGRADLVVADAANNSIDVLVGNGDGTFQAPSTLSVGADPVSVFIADFNGDGAPDVVSANYYSNSLSIAIDKPNPTIMNMDGMVMTTGTVTNDTATITITNGIVVINIDGQVAGYSMNSIHEINLSLGSGDDTVTVGAGVTMVNLSGGSGNDMLMDSNTTPDTLSGGGGGDTLMGAGNGAELSGGGGNDVIQPMGSNAMVKGGGGNDTLTGSAAGHDMLKGNGGDDIFLDSSVGDTLNGGAGLNFAQNNTSDAMSNIFQLIDPQQPAPSGAPAAAAPALAPADAVPDDSVTGSVAAGVLIINGTPLADNIAISSDGTNINIMANGYSVGPFGLVGLTGLVVVSGNGRDTVVVDQSVTLATTLRGGRSADSLVGGGGDNYLVGGNGSDTLVGGDGGTSLLEPGPMFTFTGNANGNDVLIGGAGYSIVDLSYRTDDLRLSNDGLADSGDSLIGEHLTIMPNVSAIWSGAGMDTLISTTAGEFLSGGYGKDSIQGGGASNVIYGGKGSDTIVVTAEPVALYLQDNKIDFYGGVSNPIEDILDLDSFDALQM